MMEENKITDDIPSDDDNLADNNLEIGGTQSKEIQSELIEIERIRRKWLDKSYCRAWWVVFILYGLMVLWLLCNFRTKEWHILLILCSMPTTLAIVVIRTLQPKKEKDEINLNWHAIIEAINQFFSNIISKK